MLLLVGLGNPGADHAGNRHNIGFMALNAILEQYEFAPARKRCHGLLAEGRVGNRKVLALKPMTYMNRSGIAVAACAGFHKVALHDTVVFHDELDLVSGKVRVKVGGGNAGHNGLESIDAHLGRDYRRVRLGIGHPGERDRVTGWVLHDFTAAERAWLKPLLEAIAKALPLLVKGDDPAFMSRVALLAPPPKPRPAANGA